MHYSNNSSSPTLLLLVVGIVCSVFEVGSHYVARFALNLLCRSGWP